MDLWIVVLIITNLVSVGFTFYFYAKWQVAKNSYFHHIQDLETQIDKLTKKVDKLSQKKTHN